MEPSILVVTPAHRCDAALAIAAVRAGEIGLLDLGVRVPAAIRAREISRLARLAEGSERWGLRWHMAHDLDGPPRFPTHVARCPWIAVAGTDGSEPLPAIARAREIADHVLVEVHDPTSAIRAAAAGADGVLFRAHEAGGRVALESSFLALQRLHGRLDRPLWVQGAWGPDTAAAAHLAGARGIVLCEELWLAREAPFSAEERLRLSRLDGSETVTLGRDGVHVRLFAQHDRPGIAEVQAALAGGAPWPAALHDRWNATDAQVAGPWPMGQGIAFAARAARRDLTAGGILGAYRVAIDGAAARATSARPLDADGPLARSHGTLYPLLQGPMTRVSDVPSFAAAVADAGALPFLALALMRGDEVRALLQATRDRLGARPWGVGILGFVPPELQREQLAVIEEAVPRFAIIAGGRPGQARTLEAAGIATYLHVPSPGLLESFLEQGARRFVLEGRECGGHVGPRSSFTLWQSALDVLGEAKLPDPEQVHVVFAGGVHDALSAALVQTLAAPLVARGMKIGILMGTAYLFTREAVDCGAITPAFQEEALACRETALLESGVGHATRCARTAFAEEFERRRRELIASRRSEDEIRFELEMLNVGRLRLASRGLTRLDPAVAESGTAPSRETLLERAASQLKGRLVAVDEATQHRKGLFMIGEVATLRERTTTLAELHAEATRGATALATELAAALVPPAAERPRPPEPVAIVGMACRFPLSPDLGRYWSNILAGFDAVREVSPERWRAELYYSEDRFARDKVVSKWGSFLDSYRFDPIAYGIPPASLASIEPIQLLALDVAVAALEDAGYGSRPFDRDRATVIFAAGGVNDLGMAYACRTTLEHYIERASGIDAATRAQVVDEVRRSLPEWTEDSFPGFLQNVISGRVANRLDLRGTNFVVDAACAASLAALQTALDRLRSGASDMALVGGADATNNPFMFTSFAKTHALSPSGRIRPFDERADGIVLGEGVGAVVLKRLADAERDGDRIYAVIRGIGSSSDGRNRSLTAPHTESQALAIRRAYDEAGVPPASVTLIEAHATGTAVGDRSEIAAMRAIFPPAPDLEPYCAIGSVKSMIGHTKTVAGMAGLIKTALALKHRVLPPTRNVEVPNAAVEREGGPFFINSETRPWVRPDGATPRRAGVSAFGFGGTNFHVVLEEYDRGYVDGDAVDLSARGAELLLWQRPDRASLAADLTSLAARLVDGARLDRLAAAVDARERERGAGPEPVRLAIVAGSLADLRAKLATAIRAAHEATAQLDEPGLSLSDRPRAAASELAFLFPGQGAQAVGMLQDLVQYGPFGPGALEEADRLLADLVPRLSGQLFPRPVFDDAARKRQKEALDDTRIAQPAIGFISSFACDVLRAFGLEPACAAGHSYGEHVALAEMGLLRRQDLLRSSALRGRAVHEAGIDHPGGMAAVAGSAAEVTAALAACGIDATIANVNAPRQVVIAGPVAAIEAARRALPERGLAVRRVPVTAAFHTPAMEGPSLSFARHLEGLEMRLPRVPVYSNVTAEPYPRDLAAIRAQMGIHLARPVRFVDQIRAMHRDGARIFVEVGPGRILTGFVKRILEDSPHVALALDAPGQPGWGSLGLLLGRLHALGIPIDARAWHARRGFPATSLDDLLEQERRIAVGRPTDWIVDPGGARPLSPLPGAARAPADAPPARLPVAVRPPAADPALVAQLRDMTEQWLALQEGQQRLNERFLAIQERIVAGMFGEAPPASRSGPEPRAPRRAEKGDPGGVAPAPVIPNLRPAPELPPIDPELRAASEPAPPRAADLPAAAAAAGDALDADHFRADLLAEISRRTGYPEEMLDLDAQLEAGLGIDSIKTMEIFGALKKYHPILSDEQELDEDVLVRISRMKTLRETIGYYAERYAHAGGRPAPGVPAPPAAAVSAAPAAPPLRAAIERLVLRSVPAPHPDSEFGQIPTYPRDRIVLVLGEPPEVASSLREALVAHGYHVAQLVPGRGLQSLGDGRFVVDLADPECVARVAERVRGPERRAVGAIVNLLGLVAPLDHPGLNGADAPLGLVQWLANVARVFEADVRASARVGGGWLLNVTSLDGRFGLRGGRAIPVAQAGSLGFFKSLAREWRGVRVKNLDLDPEADPRKLVVGLLQELAAADGLLEVGLDDEGRWGLALVGDEAPARARGTLPLDRDSVVLATGGADGITAAVVHRLASETGCRVVLVGRTPVEAADEPSALAALPDARALRAALIERMRAERGDVTPAEVEAELRRLLKHRRIRANLEAIRATGAAVEYHEIDVRDSAAFGRLIDGLYERFGRIDGVLHGAGVIEDARLCDKTADSVARVFETKVTSAHLLARKLRPEQLRFLVFFSSVSGRFGSAGQADYAAANEYLNKLASLLDRQWPARVVAINWGPWDAGMLSDGLRAIYTERGIGLIDVEQGVRSCLDELCRAGAGEAEVVLTCTAARIAGLDEPRA